MAVEVAGRLNRCSVSQSSRCGDEPAWAGIPAVQRVLSTVTHQPRHARRNRRNSRERGVLPLVRCHRKGDVRMGVFDGTDYVGKESDDVVDGFGGPWGSIFSPPRPPR